MTRRGRIGGSIAVAAALVVLGSYSAAVAAPDPVTLDEVVTTLGVGPKPSDFVISVDTSGSMAEHGRWQLVAESLDALAKTLLPRDHVTLISFDREARTLFNGQIGTRPEQLVAALPGKPDGAASDIGLGIQAGLKALSQPSSNDVAGFVLVTDGEHRAAKDSPFLKPGSPAWQELRTTASGLLSTRSIASYAVAMQEKTDSALLRTVFDEVTDVTADGITDQFSRLNADLVKVQAAAELRADLGGGAQTEWSGELTDLDASGGSKAVQLTITSTMQHLPLQLSNFAVTAEPLQVSVAGLPDQVELDPGESVTLPATVSWTGSGRGHLQLEAALDSSWRTVLTSDLGLDFVPQLSGSTPIQTAAPIDWGRYLPSGLATLLVLLVALIAWYARRISQPEMVGSLASTQGDEVAETVLVGRSLRFRHGELSGTAHGVRRKRDDGSWEYGVRVNARNGKQRGSGRLWEGDMLDIAGARLDYTSARTRMISLIES